MADNLQARAPGRRPDFLGGPAVAALFRAVRQGQTARDKLPRADFAVPQGAPCPLAAKI